MIASGHTVARGPRAKVSDCQWLAHHHMEKKNQLDNTL